MNSTIITIITVLLLNIVTTSIRIIIIIIITTVIPKQGKVFAFQSEGFRVGGREFRLWG